MFYHFKRCHGFLNGLALLITAAGVVVGAAWEHSYVVVGLSSLGTVVKGWNDFKKYSLKVDMCRFAYTTYEKTLIELKTYARGLPLEEFDGFLIKMQTLDDTITDFTPPVSDKIVRDYMNKFYHVPVQEHKNVGTRVRPLIARIMPKRRRVRRQRISQRGGILPLAALIPAALAAEKAAALGGISGATKFGAKKALEKLTRKKRRRRRQQRP